MFILHLFRWFFLWYAASSCITLDGWLKLKHDKLPEKLLNKLDYIPNPKTNFWLVFWSIFWSINFLNRKKFKMCWPLNKIFLSSPDLQFFWDHTIAYSHCWYRATLQKVITDPTRVKQGFCGPPLSPQDLSLLLSMDPEGIYKPISGHPNLSRATV